MVWVILPRVLLKIGKGGIQLLPDKTVVFPDKGDNDGRKSGVLIGDSVHIPQFLNFLNQAVQLREDAGVLILPR